MMSMMTVPHPTGSATGRLSRRQLLGGGVLLGLGLVGDACGRPGSNVPMPPGVSGDGTTDDTAALQRAIDRASAGRRKLTLPPGRYLSGTLHLRSKLALELMAGAVIVASPRTRDFAPIERLPYDPFADPETADQHFAVLSGDGIGGLEITGSGTIDGNRSSRGGPKLIGLKRCQDVTISGLRLTNSPNYALNLLGCQGVDITGVSVVNSYADGIDPDCCTDVHIADCTIDSFDDGICVKASLALGQPVATSNVVVERCGIRSSTNCLKIGTETGSNVSDVTFRDCTLHGRPVPGLSNLVAEGGGVAIEMVDGAVLDGVTVEDITLHDVPGPLFIRLGNRGRGQEPSPRPGVLRNVTVSDFTAVGASETSSITGVPGATLQGVHLSGIRIASQGRGPAGLGLDVSEQAGAYPQVTMFGTLPASGLYCRHVDGLVLDDVTLAVAHHDPRPPLILDDASDVTVSSLSGLASSSGSPTLWLNNGRVVHLEQAQPLSPLPVVRVSGAETTQIGLVGWLASAVGAVEVDPDVPAGAVGAG